MRGHKVIVVCVVAFLCISLLGGCEGLKYHHIYMAGVGGAAIGAIVGHQSDECAAGAGVGAAVFAVGELLHQIDEVNKRKQLEEAAEVSQSESRHDPNRVD